MLIKFLSRGTGKVSKAIDYLIADRDSKHELRHGVKILDGDSAWVRIVGDNLETKHKYTSAVLSWTVQDQPSAEQIRETLDEFYATAFAGLDEQRRSALAVLHEEQDGSKHVHVLMLRTDLKTGLAYNPAPPGHEYDFNCVRDYLNYKYNWSDPQDPLRKQIYKISRVERQQRIAALTEAKPINNTQKEQLELKSLLIESVNAEFARGAIQKHDDVKKFLSQFGGVRSVKAHGDRPSYISFTSPAFDKALRLRGQILKKNLMNNEAEHLKLKLLQQLEQSKKLQQDNFTEAQDKLNASLTPILQNLENALAQVGIDELNKTLRTMTETSAHYRRQFEDMGSEWKQDVNSLSEQMIETQERLASLYRQTAEHITLINQRSELIQEENKQLKQQIQAFEERLNTQDQQFNNLMTFAKHNNEFLADIHDKTNEAKASNQQNEKYLTYSMMIGGGALFLIFITLLWKI